jgi:hypothetical protein
MVLLAAGLCSVWSAVDPDTISDNGWARQIFSGTGPGRGGDIHWAMDTAGYAYMFGGCTYGNGAGGTHNADMYRWDLNNGTFIKFASCGSSNGGWAGGCQAAQCWDSRRNVVWYNCGFGGPCSGTCGLWKYQCPDGPITRVSGSAPGGHYYCYDPVNDKIYAPSSAYGISVYDCVTGTVTSSSYPFSQVMTPVAVPCCVDTRRGLYVTTLGGPYTLTNPATQAVFGVWFYNGATGQWTSKTPATHPEFYKAELAYDQANDKVVYFGTGADGCQSEVWAYDYDSNTWTQMDPGSRAYNDASPAASKWPPGNGKHAWEYSPKLNTFAFWGGGVWINSACSEYDNGTQPVWYYRYGSGGTPAQKPVRTETVREPLTVSPNPFTGATHITFDAAMLGAAGVGSIEIYDAAGRLVTRLAAENTAAGRTFFRFKPDHAQSGVYFLRAECQGRRYTRNLVFIK